MPSSYVDSVPPVVHMLVKRAPTTIVDIGPGWGKYGLMAREYLGPVLLHAVEVPEGHQPTQRYLYDFVHYRDVRSLSTDTWRTYGFDVALMVDVIEHLPHEDGEKLLAALFEAGTDVLVSTPTSFFEQDPGNNPHEAHVSFWSLEDLATCGRVLDDRSTPDSTIVLLGAPQ
jgi:hypothetical protein